MAKKILRQLILTVAVEIECDKRFDIEHLTLKGTEHLFAANEGVTIKSFETQIVEDVNG